MMWIIFVIILSLIATMTSLVTYPMILLGIIALFLVFPRDFAKNWKILLWVFFILISIMLIAPNLHPSGLVLTSLNRNATATDLSVGDVIYRINGNPATQDLLLASYYDIVRLETNKGTKFVRVNGTLEMAAEPVSPSNLKFGLDLKGGVRAVLQPNATDNATLEQIISTLQTRINVYGLREAVFRPVYHEKQGFVEISIAGGTIEELRGLLENQGKFEAKIPLRLNIVNGKSLLTLDKPYELLVQDSSIIYNGKKTSIGETLILSGIPFSIDEVTGNTINVTATVFSGDDIKTVFFDPQRSRIEATDSGYRWSFGVQLSSTGAQKFAWVTSNTHVQPSGYLDSPIIFYLDNKFIDSLSIASALKGRVETEIAITGGAVSKEGAIKTRTSLQSILRSGALPTSVQIVQLDTISPTLGIGFLKNAAFAGLAAILGVIIVISVRYRKPKLVLPMLFISLSEVLIVLGISVLIGWTIDLAAIAGIIASVGTGIDSQIIILDRTLRKEEERIETLKEKLKKAFFVIFGSAGTVIAAMLPLLILGFGLLRGFAIITIIGVLVGVLIARPAYGVIVEKMTKEIH